MQTLSTGRRGAIAALSVIAVALLPHERPGPRGLAQSWRGCRSGRPPAPNIDFVAIARGESHSLGLKDDGTVVAWGYDGYGQCRSRLRTPSLSL